ncbi:MAG: C4-dicarboxylate ABC transporter [Spirochaetes bacterium GWD1_61_31]|nr:MAG: C4-dicarboxylate ABC transporter [Spirochaetes bacterium GWB1_60_80]OHD39982.1 MAG: C4-dicarboxylate ABC transporter [Spirochaetes bacterium GWD1_61_31]OHD42364.1 MAG: C4-dicarboxylate ABC transporter [Spirochaetes bacterium GWE1_60_18]OHD60536.1 MAG: C4-dicarboxylate ABC transporter [Spirochaetes bacterium GWF1_60_12]HBO41438.1 C4-dicarboxylate ABC transporter [Spirochaetaceae bacterium]
MSDTSHATPTAADSGQVDSQQILKKFDKESDFRILGGFLGKAVAAIAIVFTTFQLYTAVFGVLDAMIQRSAHLSFGLVLIFLLYPASKKWPRDSIHPVDWVLAIIGGITPLYIIGMYSQLVTRAGMPTPLDIVVGIIGILLVLEAARRVVGIPIIVIACLFIVYAFVGPYIPGRLGHRGANISTLVGHLFYTTEGVFGIPLGVSSTFIFLFILFGAYLERTGLGQFFIDISNAIAGRSVGGPAKVAVLSSGLMGMISGSSVANVVGTGSFTIPMMKKLGYKPEFAGAVEATASTGGQLMPPIMGAAAFLMAEFTEIPYSRIIAAAIIPALLYYFGVWAGVHLEAKRLGLRGLTKAEMPKWKDLWQKSYLTIPLVAIIFLLVTGYTPMRAALVAIVLSITTALCASGVNLLRKKPVAFKPIDIIAGMEAGGRGALGVLSATACAGIIIGVVTLTGLGLKLGSSLVALADGQLFMTLVFTMVTSIILGMGVPTTANYVITSTIAAPAIILILRGIYPELGDFAPMIVLPAHMFAFYFGIIADVTPPVALAAFAGAGIAKANPMKTGLHASKLAVAAFMVPYIFVYNPQMLLFNVTPVDVILMVLTSVIGIVGVSAGVMGYFRRSLHFWERPIFLAGGVLMVMPGVYTDLIGLTVLICGYVLQRLLKGPVVRQKLAA